MDQLFEAFAEAQTNEIGYLLASTISPEPPKDDPARLHAFYHSSNEARISTDLRYKLQYNPGLQLAKDESATWQGIYSQYWRFLGRLLEAEANQSGGQRADWSAVYSAWKVVVNALLKGYTDGFLDAWTIPCLYIAGKYLRVFGIKADEAAALQRDDSNAMTTLEDDDDSSNKTKNLEDAARQINRIYSICNGDRNPIDNSRKWALYYIVSLLFKTYFRLSQLNLCKTMLRSLDASTDLPPLSSFPKSHQVTFNYYAGVIWFLEEDYVKAETYLETAYAACSANARRNTELILMYLIPTKLLTKHQVATSALLAPYPHLQSLFLPILSAVKSGDLAGLHAALANGEADFVKRRIYLTLERAQDVAVRNLFRKVYVAGGFEEVNEAGTAPVRRTRIPLVNFSAALLLAGAEVQDGEGGVDSDEVECMIANLMYKNMMKGYIARDRGIVVLSKAEAFPGTNL